MKRINYLNNKDILAEIAKSKNTFCSYTDSDYAVYDIILPSIEKINIRTIAEAKRRGLSTFTDKSGKKKAAVTAEELKASGLSLCDYLNKQQGKTRKGPKAPTTKPTSKLSPSSHPIISKTCRARASSRGNSRFNSPS